MGQEMVRYRYPYIVPNIIVKLVEYKKFSYKLYLFMVFIWRDLTLVYLDIMFC